MLKWALPLLILISLAFVLAWRSYVASERDPSYEQDPSAFGGMAGSIAGIGGPMVLPKLTPTATLDLHSGEVLTGFPGMSLSSLLKRLGEPDAHSEDASHRRLVWFSSVTMDLLPDDHWPVAHLMVDAAIGSGAEWQVRSVAVIGSLGRTLASSDVSGLPSEAPPRLQE
ncbi:MAG: hypothetical protein PF961_22580 [Planctomycetota bacterium]|jgi:hypothetical protein|nr:hypothetical protein [Planctomycetota bacterium]